MLKNRLNDINGFLRSVENMIAIRDDKYKIQEELIDLTRDKI